MCYNKILTEDEKKEKKLKFQILQKVSFFPFFRFVESVTK